MKLRRLVPALAGVGVVVVAGVLGFEACSGDGDREAYCQRLAQVPDVAEVLASLDASDPGGVENRIQEAVDAYAALEDDAPDAISADVALLREGVELVLTAVREHPGNLPAARQAINSRGDELEGLAAAGTRVADDARAECSLTLG